MSLLWKFFFNELSGFNTFAHKCKHCGLSLNLKKYEVKENHD